MLTKQWRTISSKNKLLLQSFQWIIKFKIWKSLYKKYSNDPILLKHFKDTNTKVDILFIDGAHDYNGVINDWRNYNGFVNSGGYIIFDDYNDYKYSPQVKPAVDEIMKHIDPIVYEIIGSPLNTLDDVSVGYNNTYGLKHSNEFILRKK